MPLFRGPICGKMCTNTAGHWGQSRTLKHIRNLQASYAFFVLSADTLHPTINHQHVNCITIFCFVSWFRFNYSAITDFSGTHLREHSHEFFAKRFQYSMFDD